MLGMAVLRLHENVKVYTLINQENRRVTCLSINEDTQNLKLREIVCNATEQYYGQAK